MRKRAILRKMLRKNSFEYPAKEYNKFSRSPLEKCLPAGLDTEKSCMLEGPEEITEISGPNTIEQANQEVFRENFARFAQNPLRFPG